MTGSGTDYYDRLERWSRFVPLKNISFVDYDKCKDVTRTFVEVAKIPGNIVFPENRHNTSLSALGSEVLRRFNKELSELESYKDRKFRVRSIIKDYFTGEPFRPEKQHAKKAFMAFSESNEKLSKAFGMSERLYFSDDFSEYPEKVVPIELTLDEVDNYVKEALKNI